MLDRTSDEVLPANPFVDTQTNRVVTVKAGDCLCLRLGSQ